MLARRRGVRIPFRVGVAHHARRCLTASQANDPTSRPGAPIAETPATRRASGSGRTPSSPRSRAPRNWRRSTPTCTRRCSATPPGPFSITLRSRRSPATDYARAVDLARASREYREVGQGDDRAPPRDVSLHRRRRAPRSVSHRRPARRVRRAHRRPARALRPRAVVAAGLVPAATLMAEPTTVERELKALETELRRLEAEYNMYFAGRLPRPPVETRRRVTAHGASARPPAAIQLRRAVPLHGAADAVPDVRRAVGSRHARARRRPPGPFAQRPPARAREGERPAGSVCTSRRFTTRRARWTSCTSCTTLADARRDAGEDAVPFHKFADLVKSRSSGSNRAAARKSRSVWRKDGKVNFTARGSKGADSGRNCAGARRGRRQPEAFRPW